MAEKDKDRLADALAALAGGEHHEPDEHADEIHGQAPAEQAQVQPPVVPRAARPAATQRPAQPVKPAATQRPAQPVKPAAAQPARPPAPTIPRPQAARPAQPAPPAKVRPQTPVLPPRPVAPPPAPIAPEAPEVDEVPLSPRRPATPEFEVSVEPPAEESAASSFVASDSPAEEQVQYEEQPADGNGEPAFDAPVDEYAEDPDPEMAADDEMNAPAPDVADFMKQRYDPRLRGLGFKRTIIPIFLVLGALFILVPLGGFIFSSEESGFRMLPTWYPIMLIIFGLVLLGFGAVTILQTKYLLKLQAEVESGK
jgi:hypothetical protein